MDGEDISWSHRENLSALDSSHPPVSISDLVTATDKDKSLAQLREIIQRGFPETKSELPGCIQSYWRVRDMLTEHWGIINLRDMVVMPESLRDKY